MAPTTCPGALMLCGIVALLVLWLVAIRLYRAGNCTRTNRVVHFRGLGCAVRRRPADDQQRRVALRRPRSAAAPRPGSVHRRARPRSATRTLWRRSTRPGAACPVRTGRSRPPCSTLPLRSAAAARSAPCSSSARSAWSASSRSGCSRWILPARAALQALHADRPQPVAAAARHLRSAHRGRHVRSAARRNRRGKPTALGARRRVGLRCRIDQGTSVRRGAGDHRGASRRLPGPDRLAGRWHAKSLPRSSRSLASPRSCTTAGAGCRR